MHEFICTVCPNGCRLRIDEKTLEVQGWRCERGIEYARRELTDPRRTVTSTVILRGADFPRLPVRTDRPIAKAKIFDCMRALDGVIVTAPVKMGQVIIKNAADSGADIISSCDAGAAG